MKHYELVVTTTLAGLAVLESKSALAPIYNRDQAVAFAEALVNGGHASKVEVKEVETIHIATPTVTLTPVSFDVKCTYCDWTGTGRTEVPKQCPACDSPVARV